MPRTIQPRKKVISKKLREEVWLKHFGKTFSAKCPVQWCTREISVFSFEAGHNIPESKGGNTTIDNLIPICGDCNRSMGDRFTIDEFSKQYASSTVINVAPSLDIQRQQKTLFQRLCCCFIRKSPPVKLPSIVLRKIHVKKRSHIRSVFYK
jgi:hypothetical protein